ncbi:hypothetical protein VP01_723g3 [Puccinia sorghi]|uniref:Uncharacterized protein n=1 Tax=Puccinia sorghi TaxID=27349 RepID=A0A0L6UD30_9BASI|nr:hypothetical protein VP01_723g3 [Puccinia sorghi]
MNYNEALFNSTADPFLAQYQPVSCAYQLWPDLNELIESWQKKVQTETDGKTVDIQQSNAWQIFSIKNKQKLSRKKLQLTFSLYVDWFNPFSNKNAGWQASMGVLALTCLDLLLKSRNKTANVFIAGMIPAPTKPELITISQILTPLKGSGGANTKKG